jgi:hypothetical protein
LLARLDVSDEGETNPATSEEPKTATDEEGESELVWPKLRDKQRAASLAPTQRLDPSVVEGMLGQQNPEDDEPPDSDS